MNATLNYASGWEWLVVLAIGCAVTVGLAALCAAATRAAIWRRTIWQGVTACLLILVVLQVTGVYRALISFCQAARACQTTGTAAPSRAIQPECEMPSHSEAPSVELSALEGGHTEPEVVSDTDSSGVQSAPPTGGIAQVAPEHVNDQADNAGRTLSGSITAEGLWAARPARAASAAKQAQGNTHPAIERRGPAASEGKTPFWPGLWSSAKQALGHVGRWLSLIWAAGAGLLLARAAGAHALLWRYRRKQQPLRDPELRRWARVLSSRLGLRRRVELLEARELAGPVALGVLRPAVILPLGFRSSFAPRERAAMLAHELAHLAAWDPLWSLSAELAVALLWWHPAVWYSRAQLRAASEAAADEASLLVPDGPDALAASLVTLGRRLAAPALGWLSVEGRGFRSGLGRRVERLMSLSQSPQVPVRRRLLLAGTALVVVMVLVSTWCNAWAMPQADFSPGGTTMGILRSSFPQSLAAAALAIMLAPSQAPAAEVEKPKDEPPKPAIREKVERPKEEVKVREIKVREMMERRRELEQEASHIRERLRSLRPEQEAEGRELRARLEKIEAHLRELPAPPRRPEAERERIRQKVEELKGALHRAREASNREEMERIEREMRELLRAAGRIPDRPPAGPPEAREDMERRAHHVRMAIENLRAAGLHDMAERLAREMGRLARERPDRPGREGPPRPERRPDAPPSEPREGPPPERLQHAIEELHGQVNELRRQMEEIREALKRFARERRGEK